MSTEVRADPSELVRLAADTLNAARSMGDGFRGVEPDLAVPAAVFGNTPSAAQLAAAHDNAASTAGAAVDCLVAVQDDDVDRLYRAAFAYRRADLDAAQRQPAAIPRGR
jgi:hypothetical protein